MEKEDLSKLRIDKSVRTFRSSKRKKFVYLIAAIGVIGAMGFLYLDGIISPSVPVEIVSISQIYPSQMISQLNASGYVVAQRKAAVASKVTGRLISLMVEEGSRVKEGQVIARLENDDAVAARDQAEANLKVAQANLEGAKAELEEASRTFNRDQQLILKGVISRSQFDTSEARFTRAQASVAAAEASLKASMAALRAANVALDYTFIRAPFDAVVLTKNADIGDIVTPLGAAANAKAAVVTIADLSSLQVEADVSETNLALVKVKQPCEIQLDALPDVRFRGEVHAIVPTADRAKATVMVKIRFINKSSRVLPEMRAKVSFLTRNLNPEEEKPRTVVLKSAVVNENGKKSVFLIQGNKVIETSITLGELFGEMVEVLGGVKAGDKVVARPPRRLRNGSRIKVVEK
ncbi:MAG: efflux RND transporter periplasmic adaptor subunit [Syntrophaceae bacterium]|nr:efflux RND transporter periplasmic adaptor subunit [Syntrophaceae bacterium]